MADEHALPDIYADSINVTAGPFGFTLTLGVTDPNPEDDASGIQRPVGRVRLSPELGAALAKALTQAYAAHRQHLAETEKDNGSS